ncbi:putative lipoprotein LpqZ [Mycobacteroides abscessus MAB_091912_2446]|uniref:Putative lipoprotein LpqZ n=1 Tax=Mycobacteroides abscessus MAB_091912_2446 TaxID=1335414 RepID=A0A829MFC8_9MYCO|nr:putative lipoprotein LpqZ [Mycobacteroides abscessus MAB_091912_2446]
MAVLAGCSENHGPAPYLTVVTTSDAQYRVLAHIYAAVVKATGIDTKVRESADPVTELDTGIASVAPGFTGRVLRRFAPQQQPSGDEETAYKAMIAALPAGVAAADYGTAEDRTALAVTSSPGASAKPTLAAFVRHCDQLARGGQVGPGRFRYRASGRAIPVRRANTPAPVSFSRHSGVVRSRWRGPVPPTRPYRPTESHCWTTRSNGYPRTVWCRCTVATS